MTYVLNRAFMRRLPAVAGLVVGAVLLASFSGVGTASATPPPIPMNVTFTETSVVVASPCPGAIHFAATGSFSASAPLLRTSRYQGEACFTATGTLVGSFTITAHNGATIFGTATGTTDGTDAHLTETITGGTKQFRRSSGSLDLSLVAVSNGFPGPIVSNATLVGTIQR